MAIAECITGIIITDYDYICYNMFVRRDYMIFVWPILTVISLYYGGFILAAVIPAVVLMRYVYKKDTVEPESGKLLTALIIGGVLAALCSMVLETVGEILLGVVVSPSDPYYAVLSAYLVVAVVEEGTKMFFMKLRTWKSYEFNFVFDGIVYAVFTSLGFAAFENILYVADYGIGVAIPRAILSIPGHMCFAVFMGAFYGRAKALYNQGRRFDAKVFNLMGYGSAVLLHGFYDSCLMCEDGNMLVFIIFVIAMYIFAHKLIVSGSKNDRPL